MNPEVGRTGEEIEKAAAYIAQRLDRLSDVYERGWTGRPTDDGGFVFERTLRGVREAAIIDAALLGSSDARKLDRHAATLQEVFVKAAVFRRKDTEVEIRSPSQLFEAIMAAGRKGLSLQRYKGLGEMNPDQLWETTLDPNVRSLMQVRVKEMDEADETFSQLMGDVVEPRRDFIQANALYASVDV
jgi:DNA gyrase subunit B